MGTIYGNLVGGSGGGVGKTLELIDEAGFSLVGTIVDKVVKFDATPNDVRKGKTFCCDSGSLVGEKEIPAYYTTQGQHYVWPDEAFSIPLSVQDKYDYTQLQCIILPYQGSVSAEKIVSSDGVYAVESIEKIYNVTKNSATKSIDLNFNNNTDNVYLIKYFTYKEE